MPKLSAEELSNRQCARTLLSGAIEYRDTALFLIDKLEHSADGAAFKEMKYYAPCMFLCAQSAELSFKSILLTTGETHEFLQRKVGHDLIKATDRIKFHLPESMQLLDELREPLDMMNSLYKDKELQYRIIGVRDGPGLNSAKALSIVAIMLAEIFVSNA